MSDDKEIEYGVYDIEIHLVNGEVFEDCHINWSLDNFTKNYAASELWLTNVHYGNETLSIPSTSILYIRELKDC